MGRFLNADCDGGALANNINANWGITIDYTLSEAANFDGVVDQWAVNGVAVSPLSNFGSICCATASNPILPGEAFYNSGFNDDLPAGEQTNWNQIYVDPYSFVSAAGINASTADDFTFALHFDPQQSSTPEPATLSLIGAGLIALAIRRRCARKLTQLT